MQPPGVLDGEHVRAGDGLPQPGPDVARLPGVKEWTAEDLRVLANLIVGSMVETAEAIITAPPGRPDVEREIQRTAETQLRMVVIGAVNWRSSTG